MAEAEDSAVDPKTRPGVTGDASAPYGYCVDPNFKPNPLDVGSLRTDEVIGTSAYDLKAHSTLFDGGKTVEAALVAQGHTPVKDLPFPDQADVHPGVAAARGIPSPQGDPNYVADLEEASTNPSEAPESPAEATEVSPGSDAPIGTVEEARGPEGTPANPTTESTVAELVAEKPAEAPVEAPVVSERPAGEAPPPPVPAPQPVVVNGADGGAGVSQ